MTAPIATPGDPGENMARLFCETCGEEKEVDKGEWECPDCGDGLVDPWRV